MKNVLKGLLLVLILTQVFSCRKTDILDPKSNNDLNLETTFADSSRTSDFLMGIYSYISREYSIEKWYDIRMGITDATDESNHRLGDLKQPNGVLISGTLSSANSTGNHPYRTTYIDSYLQIRQINLFLANVGKSPFSEPMKITSKAEARFLRIWYYHLLVRGWGGAILLGDELLSPNDVFDRPRSSYDESVKYMVSELNAIENDLPASWDSQNYGRITSVAVKALKSRILLIAASPLTNGGNMGTTPAQKLVVGYDSYSEQRWVDAANAAKEALNLADANGYGLLVMNTLDDVNKPAPGYGFAKAFLLRRNKESLLQGMQVRGGNNRLGQALLPPQVNSSATANNRTSMPTHNLVKQFLTINGKPTNEDPQWNANDPYKNRDPRLGYSIITNGTNWRTESSASQFKRIYTYVGEPNGNGFTGSETNSYWYTGYFNRKMLDSTSTGGSAGIERVWHLIRYAEVVLNYAEAANESGQISVAYDQIKALRARAGIRLGADGMYGLKPNLSKDAMRAVVMNERTVELAFEGHRYYDVRRTKTAMDNQNITMMAMKITKSGNASTVSPSDTFTYEEVPVAGQTITHVFYEPNYWFPMHKDETDKNPAIVQNPGY